MPRPPVPPLPLPLTPILGREAELTETAGFLSANRMLTITGAGGSGKTRLALELARTLACETCASAWVDLASIDDPELVGEQILLALGRHDSRADDVLQSVIDAIGARPLLLVLDNCEHLVDRAALFAEHILRYCPETTILATSREALGVAGEQTWLVPPLSADAAAELFIDRARAVKPSFQPDSGAREKIAQICARLDGIPLAVELAAARIRALSVDEIAARLDDAFKLLASGNRNLPRHRTIHETIDWSYRLLAPDEQRLLQRLSVFTGSFSLEAVERVCSDAELDALTTLSSLVDKSLVMSEGGTPARFRLLDTVRQFAAAHWTSPEDRSVTSDKQAQYSVRLMESIAPRLYGGTADPEATSLLEAELGNVRTLLDAGIDRDVAARLMYSLAWYGFAHGHFAEAKRRITAALAEDESLSPEATALLSLAGAIVGAGEGDWDHVCALAARAIEPLRKSGQHEKLATAWSLLGAGLAFTEDDGEAVGNAFRNAIAGAERAGDARVTSFTFYWKGIASGEAADFERAAREAANVQAHALAARALTGLAEVQLAAGEPQTAANSLAAALDLFSGAHDTWGATSAIEAVARTICSTQAEEAGARLLAGASAARLRLGFRAPRRPSRDDELRNTICDAMRDDRLRTVVASGAVMSDDALLLLAREELSRRATPRVPPLRVRALGRVEIERDGTRVDESARARELLLYLLCHPAGRTKDQIGAALWPDSDSAKVRNNFHVTLHRLRALLGSTEWILVDGDTYVLDRSRGVETDFERFEREANAALRAHNPGRLQQAVDLYRGDFGGDSSSEWQRAIRERLRDLFAKSLETLARDQESAGDHAAASTTWERIVALDDLDEEAARRLIQSLQRAGDPAGAKRAWKRLAKALDRELGVEPSVPMP